MIKFFSPFKFLKKFLPHSLFGRSLIILITPIILVQSITAYIFIDRHLDKVTQLLADDIAGKISGALNVVIPASGAEFPALQGYVLKHYALEISLPSSHRKAHEALRIPPYDDEILREALKRRLDYPFKVSLEDEHLIIEVTTPRGLFIFKDQLKHLYPKTTAILLWWIILTPFIFLFISIIFLKNQIKPLSRLSRVVDDFGRGQNVNSLKPTGSFEMRKVIHAFNIMKERIRRQMTQRTEMLAGISHDLKTPLTRMELQLAMMKPSESTGQLSEDIRDMSHMIEEFLAFAKGEEGEETQRHNFSELVLAVAMKYNFSRITLDMPPSPVYFSYRQNAMTRCLSNLIGNAMKYAKNLRITLTRRKNHIEIYFDDDGPGISEFYREEVFRPFFRLEESRNNETGGVGLGLAITRDIIHAHGGTICLEDSSLGGLRASIRLPI